MTMRAHGKFRAGAVAGITIAAAVSFFLPSIVWSQTPGANTLEEIEVTAQRRELPTQAAPLPVEVLHRLDETRRMDTPDIEVNSGKIHKRLD